MGIAHIKTPFQMVSPDHHTDVISLWKAGVAVALNIPDIFPEAAAL
jgi:hypothetical protein